MSYALTALLASGVSFLMFPSQAHAYIDPGTGSFLIQIIFSAVLTAAVAIKIFWYNLKEKTLKLLGKTPASKKPEDAE